MPSTALDSPVPTNPSATRAETTARLFAELAHATGEADRDRIRHEIVTLNMRVAESIAARYGQRGVELDDLRQVAYMGMVKAVAGFDPSYGSDFLQYAVPTVTGEVKRYFRDSGWVVRPPRRVQENQARVAKVSGELTQSLGRSARPSEVAAELGVDVEEVIEAMSAYGCFRLASLDLPIGDDDSTIGDLMPAVSDDLERAETRLLLGPALDLLSERDRRILTMRFAMGWTQDKIASEIGVTQMQVSRLLTRILRDLRRTLTQEPPQGDEAASTAA